MVKVLVTGASGFLGRPLFNAMRLNPSIEVIGTSRSKTEESGYVHLPDISSASDLGYLMESMDVVVHTAARSHVMNETAIDPLSEYLKTNRDGALNLARQAALCGVKRFIFISSIKVNGEKTEANHPFSADAKVAPEDAYGISKYEAEQGLLDIANSTGMKVVIIRPPLIYGPGVKGNLARLIRWVERGIPLPLGKIHNKRSFIALDNLIDLITTCISHPAAVNQIFLASDGEDLSTTELLYRLGQASGIPSRLLPVPEKALYLALSILGKKEITQRLLSSLQLDISKTRELLDWKPPVSVDEGLRRCFLLNIGS